MKSIEATETTANSSSENVLGQSKLLVSEIDLTEGASQHICADINILMLHTSQRFKYVLDEYLN